MTIKTVNKYANKQDKNKAGAEQQPKKAEMKNYIALYVQTIPDNDALKRRCELFNIDIDTLMNRLRSPEEQKVFLPLAYQKICGIGIAAYVKGPQSEKGKLIWRSFVGEEKQTINATLGLLHQLIEFTKPNYPVIVTEDGGSFGLRNIYRKGLEFYQQDKLEGTQILDEQAKKALRILFDDSDQWGDRQPNYLKVRFGKNVIDISDKYFAYGNDYDVKTMIGEELVKKRDIEQLSNMIADSAINIFKSYAMIQDLVHDLQLPEMIFNIEKYKAKVLKTEFFTSKKQEKTKEQETEKAPEASVQPAPPRAVVGTTNQKTQKTYNKNQNNYKSKHKNQSQSKSYINYQKKNEDTPIPNEVSIAR